MHSLRISEDIIPFVVITQNGNPSGVLITPEDYDRFVLKQAFLDSVNAGLIDSDAQNVVSNKEVLKEFCL